MFFHRELAEGGSLGVQARLAEEWIGGSHPSQRFLTGQPLSARGEFVGSG